jgi:YggT family protein
MQPPGRDVKRACPLRPHPDTSQPSYPESLRKAHMAYPFYWLVSTLINLIVLVLIINAVLSWLFAFEIVSRRNQFVSQIYTFTQKLTEPMLRPIRRVIPYVGGMDLSPVVLILGLMFIDVLLQTGLREMRLM